MLHVVGLVNRPDVNGLVGLVGCSERSFGDDRDWALTHRNLKARWFLGDIASDPSRHLDGACACAHVGAENLAKL